MQCHIAELQKCPTTSQLTARGAASSSRSSSIAQQADCSAAANSASTQNVDNTPMAPWIDSKGDRRSELDSESTTPTENRAESDSRCVIS